MPTSALPDIVISTPLWLALVTTAVGALEGALLVRRPDGMPVDFVGASIFALFLGLGGGFARDIVLGNTPVMAIRTPWYLITVVAALLVVLVAGRWIPENHRVIITLDALTLGLYAAIGTQYALDFGVSWAGAIFVGTLAGVAGGVIVSLLRRQVPAVLKPGFPYALLAAIGSGVYLLLAPIDGGLASFAAVATVMLLRWLTLRYSVKTRAVGVPH